MNPVEVFPLTIAYAKHEDVVGYIHGCVIQESWYRAVYPTVDPGLVFPVLVSPGHKSRDTGSIDGEPWQNGCKDSG